MMKLDKTRKDKDICLNTKKRIVEMISTIWIIDYKHKVYKSGGKCSQLSCSFYSTTTKPLFRASRPIQDSPVHKGWGEHCVAFFRDIILWNPNIATAIYLFFDISLISAGNEGQSCPVLSFSFRLSSDRAAQSNKYVHSTLSFCTSKSERKGLKYLSTDYLLAV
ncbi:hypothetical protein LAZ67_13002365 [Cordylochernes scorpioides]|uniref:Uncharacterized protein n=1 Tax=Cordylochernes scorpioides TaxID=51811 RepID=A0ABY6L819_9ARAC|nr:hypothetical protein LAZ67_13002365 [Cordylochernes scorpioides]